MGHTKNNNVLIHDNVIMSTKKNYGFMYGGKYSGCSLMWSEKHITLTQW